MENRINQIITTDNGNKYMILHQAIYEGQNYFVCCGVEADDDLNDNFYLFKEVKGNTTSIELVEDEAMAKFILEHLDLIEKDEK
nr:hypothetical protein [Bacilli bacterium]